MYLNTKFWFKDLKKFKNSDVPLAIAMTLTYVADEHQKEVKKTMLNLFTLRNKFTEKSLRKWKARPKRNIKRINSFSGSISPYIAVQDKGGIVRGKRRKYPAPTKRGRTSRSLLKPRAYRYRLSKVGKIQTGESRQPGKMFYLRTRRADRRGFFIRTKRAGLKKIYYVAKSSVRVRGTRFWQRANKKIAARSRTIQNRFNRAARKLVYS